MIEKLTEENYYESYQGWNLRFMVDRLRGMSLPQVALNVVRNLEKAEILVLGSATPDNLGQLAVIDNMLRPGKVEGDKVTVVDLNEYPLISHRRVSDQIEGKSGWGDRKLSTKEFPYPKYVFVQADMRKIPLGNASEDIIVSDYTLNFLSKIDDVNKTFKEIARVLKPNGLLLVSVRGNPKYGTRDGTVSEEYFDDAERIFLEGKFEVFLFPMQAYVTIASRNGMRLLTQDEIGSDIFAVFIKEDH